MFTSVQTQAVFFTPISCVKTSMNRVSTILLSASAIEMQGYLTEVSFTPYEMGKKTIEYTHLLYTDYQAALESTNGYVVIIDSNQYTIEETMKVYNNHHIEFGLKRIKE